MSKFRFLFSALAISIGMLVAEPFTSLDVAFAQSLQEAARLNQKAIQLYNEGRYAEAEPLYRRSLTIRGKVLGPRHPKVATVLNNLASLYQSQGRYEALG